MSVRLFFYLSTFLLLSSLSNVQAAKIDFLDKADVISVDFTEPQSEDLLRPLIKSAIKTRRLEAKAAKLALAVNKQAYLEKELIDKILRSEGFYEAIVVYELKGAEINYTINSGKVFTISKVDIISKLDKVPNPEDLGLFINNPVRAESILSAVKLLKQHIEKQYCLWRIDVSYEVDILHSGNGAEITLTIADNIEAKFSNITIIGASTIDSDYLLRRINIKPEQCFKRGALEAARLNLFQTGLLSNVDMVLSRNNDKVAVEFNVIERKQKTVKAGIGFSSDVGIGVSGGWEHRNSFGKAEKLELSTEISEVYQAANSTLTLPDFLNPKQLLVLNGEITHENPDSYTSTSIAVSASLRRKLAKYLTGSVGNKFELILLNDAEDDESDSVLGLVSFPLGLNYDSRDNLLNPAHGVVLNGEVTPFFDSLDIQTSFIKTILSTSLYHNLANIPLRPTLALRLSLGSIAGQETADIPENERFYVGGGGSVRGYAYQSLGVLDSDNDPVGGRSFITLALETRLQLTDKWGFVIFLDGGNSYDANVPDLDYALAFAYGAGIRYYTSFAPIRLDVSIPIDKRVGLDDSLQIYISIGQAF